MAISNNLIMQNVTGTLGKQLVFRIYRGKQIISAYPDMSERVLSEKQIALNNRMKEANRIVKLIKADEQQRNAALLRLNVTSKQLHHALISEQMLKLKQLD